MKSLSKRLLRAAATGFLGVSVAFTALTQFANTAKASLIGDTVGCNTTGIIFGNCTPTSQIVGAGVEFLIPFDAFNSTAFEIDVDANSVTVTNSGPVQIFLSSTVGLTGLDWVNDATGIITGITNFSTTATGGIAVGSVQFAAHSVSIDLLGNWSTGQFLKFDFVTDHAATVVPLPAALPLFGTGLGILGFLGWRRKRKVAAAG